MSIYKHQHVRSFEDVTRELERIQDALETFEPSAFLPQRYEGETAGLGGSPRDVGLRDEYGQLAVWNRQMMMTAPQAEIPYGTPWSRVLCRADSPQASYGGMYQDSLPYLMADMNPAAGWRKWEPFDTAFADLYRITYNPGAATWQFGNANIYHNTLIASFEHNEVNAGRSFSFRLALSDGSAATFPISFGIGRNVGVSNVVLPLPSSRLANNANVEWQWSSPDTITNIAVTASVTESFSYSISANP